MRGPSKPWTMAEIKLLAHLIKRNIRRPLICEKLNRTAKSVCSQITRMKLQSRGQREWDDTQDEALKRALRNMQSIRRIAFGMDRSVASVKGRMFKLGLLLKKPETFGGEPIPCKRHMVREFNEVVELIRQGKTDSEISRLTGRVRWTVRTWRKAA